MMARNRIILIIASVTWLMSAGIVLNKHIFGLALPFGEGSEFILMGVTSLIVLMLSKNGRPSE